MRRARPRGSRRSIAHETGHAIEDLIGAFDLCANPEIESDLRTIYSHY